jgi:hypothetical protein
MPDTDVPLPNLLIAGVTKAGTTSLFAYLAQHPEICASSEKDINYFSPLRRGDNVTRPLSVHRRYFVHCQGERYLLDASPDYFNGGREVVEAVHEHYPKPKIIVIVRNPVTRLWSAFRYRKSIGRLPPETTFDEFFDDCLESYRLERYGNAEYEHHRTLPEARYAEHLALWFEAFGDDVRVAFSEDVLERPADVVRDLCRWLDIDVDAAGRIEYAAHNVTMEARSEALQIVARRINQRADVLFRRLPRLEAALRNVYAAVNAARPSEQMTPAQRARVNEFYADANRELATQLSARGYRNVPDWLATDVTGG